MSNYICINKDELLKRIEELGNKVKKRPNQVPFDETSELKTLKEVLNSSTITAQELWNNSRKRCSKEKRRERILDTSVDCEYEYEALEEYINNREKP